MTDVILEAEIKAYLCGGAAAAEYSKSIGKSDLATFTYQEWVTFCECMCKNYDEQYDESMMKVEDEIPF